METRAVSPNRLRTRLAVLLTGLWICAAGIPAALLVANPPVQLSSLTQNSQPLVLAGLILLHILVGALIAWLLSGRLTGRVQTLLSSTRKLVEGSLNTPVQLPGRDELSQLAEAIGVLAAQLRSQTDLQERRTLKRTAALQAQLDFLDAITQISLDISSIRDSDLLARRLVQLILERLNLYFVGLYLFDASGEWAVLRSGTGEIGERLLSQGHRIPAGMGFPGMRYDRSGTVPASSMSQPASEGGSSGYRSGITGLPAARSEISLPLRAGGRVFGFLLVQSARAGAFDEEKGPFLKRLADLIAVAWENARQFTESREALETSRRVSREYSRQSWQELTSLHPEWGYRYTQGSLEAAHSNWQPDMLAAAQTGETVLAAEDATLSIPILVRGESIGALRLTKKDPGQSWQQDEVSALKTVAAQVGQAIESARLYQDTQNRALREQVAGTVAARIRESLDLDTVLQTAVREVGQALGLDEVSVFLSAEEIQNTEPGQ